MVRLALAVGIGCSQDERRACRGRLSLRVRRGTARLYKPAVPGRILRRVRGCDALPVHVVLTTRDTAGRRRTLRERIGMGSVGIACDRPMLLLVGPEAGW